MSNRKYGWRPDLPDHRDLAFTFRMLSLPEKVDLRHLCPPIYDQGELGSCTAQAIAAAYQQATPSAFMPSRLFIYYNERILENSTEWDSGAQLRSGFKAINKWGICDEQLWGYDESKFAQKPIQSAYTTAEQFIITDKRYARLNQNLEDLQQCLANGNPFVFGFSVYDGFESEEVSQTGVLNLPANNESMLGGHAVLCVGYINNEQRFIARNSWGDWGMQGYFTMPYDYLTNSDLSSDFWVLYAV